MTFERRSLLVAPLAALLGVACGNYSNEDLEYMNALPDSSELRADIPPVTGAVEIANEAELARLTHKTTRDFNGLLMGLLDIVDFVRSFPPTSRTAESRTWGPIPPDRSTGKNLDWHTRMVVEWDAAQARFAYHIDVHHDGTADDAWITFIDGWFEASHTARRGVGFVELQTAAVRAAGLDVSNLGMLDHLEIDYDTVNDPTSIEMTVTSLPDPASAAPATIFYTYRATAAGQGQMTFDLFANVVAGPAIEDMRVVSDWLATGEGRATLTIVSGDGMGLQQTECWNQSFGATFNQKPWAPGENVGTDPASLCPTIPSL
jgi:hypothetical protein